MKITFIVGSGHCGSTLLDLLLDSHPDIVGVGELDSLKRRVDERTSAFWSDITRGTALDELSIFRSKRDFIFNRMRFYMSETHKPIAMRSYCALNSKLFSAVLEKTGKTVIVDSSKSVDRVEALASCPNTQASIIHIVRDGRGVTWSYLKKYPHKTWYALSRWFLANSKIEITRIRSGLPYLFVRYERLARNPEQEIRRIMRFLDMPYDDRMLRFREYEHNQIGGNRMKYAKDDIREDAKWKDDMPARYRFLFNLLFGWMNLWYKVRRT